MAIFLSTGLRNKLLSVADFQTAFAGGVIEIRDGPQPANADAAVRGNLLGTVTKNAAAWVAGTPTNGLTFAEASAGSIVKNPAENWQIGDSGGVAGAVAPGTAGWFRLKGNVADGGAADTTGVYARLDGSIATAGSDLNLPNTTFVVGTPVTIDVFTFTLPAS